MFCGFPDHPLVFFVWWGGPLGAPPRAHTVRPYEKKQTACVAREKVNWPEGPREAGLGRDLGARCSAEGTRQARHVNKAARPSANFRPRAAAGGGNPLLLICTCAPDGRGRQGPEISGGSKFFTNGSFIKGVWPSLALYTMGLAARRRRNLPSNRVSKRHERIVKSEEVAGRRRTKHQEQESRNHLWQI